MIPTNRPVIGQDLDDVRQAYGLSVADACWLFGLSITKWSQMVRGSEENPDAPNEPIKDPTLALLIRFLDTFNDVEAVPSLPTAEEMFELLNSSKSTPKKEMSILLGSEETATYRWTELGTRQPPAVGRLMYFLRLKLLGCSTTQRIDFMSKWESIVRIEGTARGVDDVFKAGSWNPETVARKQNRNTRAPATGRKSGMVINASGQVESVDAPPPPPEPEPSTVSQGDNVVVMAKNVKKAKTAKEPV